MYRVVSGLWRIGYVLARSSYHAVVVAQETGLHSRSRSVRVWEVDATAIPEIEKFCSEGKSGRILFAVRWFRPYVLLIKENR